MRLPTPIQKGIDWFLDALYPPDAACFACNNEAALDSRGLCETCAPQINSPEQAFCPPPGIQAITAGLFYSDALHSCIYHLKYGDAQYLARPLARLMRLPAGCKPDFIVPVPLHPKRLRARGYNQSALLALEFSRMVDIPVSQSCLTRVRETKPQASLNKAERATNVSNAFSAQGVQDKTILLVDDIFTTGHTLSACAAALRANGAAEVYAACACAADPAHTARQHAM